MRLDTSETSTGGTLAAPLGAVASGDVISGILFPSASGAFARREPAARIRAVNYNFGEFPQTPISSGVGKPPVLVGVSGSGGGGTTPSIAHLNTSLAVSGTSDRFLIGSGSNLSLTGTVTNTGSLGSGNLNWQITSLSPSSLSFTSSSGVNLAPGSSAYLAGTVSGTGLSPGIQSAIVTVSGVIGTSGTPGTSGGTAQIDAVSSRGIDSVTTANLGRILQGDTATSTLTVASTGTTPSSATSP